MMNTRSLVASWLLGMAAPIVAQITVGVLPASGILCANTQVELPYDAVGTFNAGNVFTAELSDVNGSFASPTVLGSVASTASGTITCTFPAGLSGTGFQLRVNSSDPVELGVPTAGLLMEAPNAGVNSVASVCGNSIQAFPFLNGSPDMGGTWSIHMGIGVWMFDDQFTGMANGEVLRYLVTSPNGCTDTALVFVNTSIPPFAGANTSISVCTSDGPFSMYQVLGGFPDAGGTWTSPGGNPQPPTFTPGVSSPGCYTYTVLGIPPCPNAASALCITISPVANAGTDASLNWCQSSGALDLFAQLGGTPAPGGTWTDDSATGALSGSTFNPAGVPSGTYVFTYAVGGGACPAASASVTVNHSGVCLVPPQYPYPVE
ncbi:MAG TPA: hypothetical protein PLN54_06420 [Flavobacteriales bacterium]|nr:hypothetical protein [Flavobacteriales bacterium]